VFFLGKYGIFRGGIFVDGIWGRIELLWVSKALTEPTAHTAEPVAHEQGRGIIAERQGTGGTSGTQADELGTRLTGLVNGMGVLDTCGGEAGGVGWRQVGGCWLGLLNANWELQISHCKLEDIQG
jgi:hypothetical protein